MKIKGNTVGTTMPRANLLQEDPKMADYVFGREEFLDEAVASALSNAKESGEFDGEDGDAGGYYIPQVRQEDQMSVQIAFTPSDADMPAVAPARIYLPEGPGGDPGEDGRGIVSIKRKNGNGSPGTTDTYAIVYTDNTSSTFTVYNGKDGKDGVDAYSPSVTITDIDGGHRVTITDKDGTNSFDVMDGKDGEGGGSGGSLMIVYSGQDTTGIATRTSKEIYDHVTAGGRAVWCYRSGEHCGLTLCSEEQVIFTYINPEENLLDGLVIYDDGSYELYENSFVPFNYLDNRLTPIENRLAALENIPNASGVSF
jgi:hypothetical protein